MAGHYFYDPRPFYGLNMSTNLMPLDELFYKYEPVPYWMDQRMAPMSFPDYHSGHKQMVSRGSEMQQFVPYKRPELVRDDIYTDMYKRSPQFNGFGAYPEMRQLRGQTQDDTWVHTMTPQYGNPQNQFAGRGLELQQAGMIPQQSYGTLTEMPMPMSHMTNNGGQQYNNMRQVEVPMSGHMNNQNFSNNSRGEQYGQMEVTNKGNKNHGSNNNGGNNKNYNNDDSYSNKSNKQMYNNDDVYSNKSNKQMYNNDDNYSNKGNKQMNIPSNQQYSNGSNGNSNYGMATKQGNSKQGQAKQQQRYTNNDSSSDDDDDEYKNGSSKGGKWGSTKPLLKHGKADSFSHNNKYDNQTSSKKSGKSDYQSYGGNNMVVFDSGKKQSGQKHGSQSKTSKMLYQNGGDSSSDEDESYAYSKKASKGQHGQGITKVQHSHGHGGKEQSRGYDTQLQNYGQQAKHTQFHSQSKSVELKVPICCDNCERKVRACLEYVDGVESVLCDQWQRKVIVFGNVKPETILKRVKRVKKGSELWQQAKRLAVY